MEILIRLRTSLVSLSVDQQKVKIKAILTKQKSDRVDTLRAMQTRLSKNRTEVMEMMLYSDAANRGEMTKGDY